MRRAAATFAFLLLIAAPFWIVFRVRHARRVTAAGGRVQFLNEALLLTLLAYGVAVWTVTVHPLAVTSGRDAHVDIIPFGSTLECLRQTFSERDDLLTHCTVNFAGNLALLFPLGLLLPLVWPRVRSGWQLLCVALIISAGIETIQLFEIVLGGTRSADIDNVILNVLGARAGYLCYKYLLSPQLSHQGRAQP